MEIKIMKDKCGNKNYKKQIQKQKLQKTILEIKTTKNKYRNRSYKRINNNNLC